MLFRTKSEMVAPDSALSGRTEAMPVPARHAVLGTPLQPPWPDGMRTAVFGMGCFWGSEELYWQLPGVYSTAVGYAGGFTPNPTYEETCTGRTGHAEVVLVVYDPRQVSYDDLLAVFWENHDPTLGMRQGNDVGTQYRSAILTTSPEQQTEASASRDRYQQALDQRGHGPITTEIAPLGSWYYAEPDHQQYLHHRPHGYRCHAKSGVAYPR
jgi:peptide-methionine (S)-S-oxide reductase